MGLDMYLYRVSKPNNLTEGEKYSKSQIGENITLIEKEEEKNLCKTMLKNAINITVIEGRYVPELVGKAGGIKGVESISCVYQRIGQNSEIEFECYDKDRLLGRVMLSGEKMRSCIKDTEVEYLAVGLEEVDYQRKGLNDYGWEQLPGNCVYSDKKTLINNMVQRGGLRSSFKDNWVKGETVFLAWW